MRIFARSSALHDRQTAKQGVRASCQRQRDGLVRSAELRRRTDAEMEYVAIDLYQSDLLLSRPIWKQVDVHFVLERLLGLVDM
jgi:hypothetical protein